MARFIDAELLEPEDFENCTPYQAKEIIDDIPTADVVPKSEIAKIFEEIESEIKLALESNYKAKREHIDKNYYCLHAEFLSAVQGKIDALRGIDNFLAELKKTYTEGEHNGN